MARIIVKPLLNGQKVAEGSLRSTPLTLTTYQARVGWSEFR
jgi:hypothetical protein